MKLTHTKTLLASLTTSTMIACSAAAATVPFDFGTMSTTGSPATGWVIVQGGAVANAAFVNDSDAAGDAFWFNGRTGSAVGTSDGDELAVGDYTINFWYEWGYVGGLFPVEFEAYAWDGSTETFLGAAVTDTAPTVAIAGSLSFSADSSVVGQDLRLKVYSTAAAASDPPTNSYNYFDTITGTFTPVPEPSSLALLGLGGLLIARRRRS